MVHKTVILVMIGLNKVDSLALQMISRDLNNHQGQEVFQVALMQAFLQDRSQEI